MSCPSTRTNLVLAIILAIAGAVLVTRAARGDHASSADSAPLVRHHVVEPFERG